MTWARFTHEAMATAFEVVIAEKTADYARQAATAAWRELDRLEGELSRFIESSDIARASRLACGETISIGEDAMQCLLEAARWSEATGRAFDPAYASLRADGDASETPLFALDPAAHTLTSLTAGLRLDLGAVGKGYALDRMAEVLRDWDITRACLQSGGSTALALSPPPDETGWPVGAGDGPARRILQLESCALSGSGIAVQGRHLVDPRTGASAVRASRVWALAPGGAAADALSTAFFVMRDDEIAAFCAAYPNIGAAIEGPDATLSLCGSMREMGDR